MKKTLKNNLVFSVIKPFFFFNTNTDTQRSMQIDLTTKTKHHCYSKQRGKCHSVCLPFSRGLCIYGGF